MRLRRQALENGKTMSRKAKARAEGASVASSPHVSPSGSRVASRAASRAPSRSNSRAPSRVPSTAGSPEVSDNDDPVADFGHDTSFSDLSESGLDELLDRMEDRDFAKGDSKNRSLTINVYGNSIATVFQDPDRQGRLEDMLPIILRYIREGTAGPATIPALRAVAVTAITCGDESGTIFSILKDSLRVCVYDSEFAPGQAAAIRALSITTFFGGADYSEVIQIMDFFLDIVESDGGSVEALDNSIVVAAAIQEWSFLSTLITVDEPKFSRALEIFGDQLESSSHDVLTAAAEGIALILESAYTLKTTDDESVEVPLEEIEMELKVAGPYRRKNWIKTFDLSNTKELGINAKINELSKSSMRHIRKDTRKELHALFRDVAHAIEYPWRGPRYSTAMDDQDFNFYGHRLFQANMTIDRWWKLHRLNGIRRILQDGLIEHLENNVSVEEALRDCLEAPSRFKQNREESHGFSYNEETSKHHSRENLEETSSKEDNGLVEQMDRLRVP